MIKVKTSELSGPALDWAVWLAYRGEKGEACRTYRHIYMGDGKYWSPSEDWSQGGPLIEKYRVNFYRDYSDEETPTANVTGYGHCASGDTVLIASMRVIVEFKLGDTVEIPEELIK